jgi:hypothetical protein
MHKLLRIKIEKVKGVQQCKSTRMNKAVSHVTLEKDFVLVVGTMEVTTKIKVKRKPKPQKV